MSIKNVELTHGLIKSKGFKRINNSMFRYDKLTLQSAWIHEGDTLFDKILSAKKGYKACYDGKFIGMIENEQRLDHVLMMYCT
jgi:hypothetical protein